MITLIHGDDIAASRKYFLELKQKFPETSILDGQQTDLTSLAQILEGGGLFTDEKILFLENLLTKKKTSSDFKEILQYLSSPKLSAKVFLWENKEVERGAIAGLKDLTIKLFKLPQSLFIFLDNIKPGNGKQLLKLFHQTLSTLEEEAIFYMLIRHFRLLLALHPQSQTKSPLLSGEGQGEVGFSVIPRPVSRNSAQIEELNRMQPWQKSKLQKQSSQFLLEQLLVIYKKLFDLEIGQKTGGLTLPLSSSIDILLFDV